MYRYFFIGFALISSAHLVSEEEIKVEKISESERLNQALYSYDIESLGKYDSHKDLVF